MERRQFKINVIDIPDIDIQHYINKVMEKTAPKRRVSNSKRLLSTYGGNPPDLASAPRTPRADAYEETVNYAKYKEGFFPAPVTCAYIEPGIYEPTQFNSMYGIKSVTVTCDDFIPLNENHISEVFEDIQKFWKCEAEYTMLKIIHKRGILLYGEPGCGKTHVINRLTEIATSNGGIVILGHMNPEMTIAAIRLIKSVEPDKKIMVILEDIDSLFKKFEESSFLQMLDGGLQVTNVVFVATTNHPEMLHDRITNRPSRFDLSIEIGKPNDESRRMFITNKFSQIKYKGDVELFVKKTKDLTISHIKEVIVAVCILNYDFDKALARVKGMKKPRIHKNDSIGFVTANSEE